MSSLGPIVGHTTTTTTRIWVRNPMPLGDIIVSPSGPQVVVTKHGLGRDVSVVDVANLRPATTYSINIKDQTGVLIGTTARVRTLSDDRKAPLRLFFGSCYRQTIPTKVWELMHKRHGANAADALFLIGDQVYADDLFPLNGAQLRDAHEARYTDVWTRPFIRDALAEIPTYMTWDDHEIVDDWGTRPSTRFGEPGAETKFDTIDEVYRRYQLAHSPVGPVANGPRDYGLTMGCVGVYVLDGRGERGKDVTSPVIGKAQFERLKGWLAALSASVEIAMLVTSVPLSFLNNQVVKNAIDTGADLARDAADLWTYWGNGELHDNRPDFLRIAGALFDWQSAVAGRRVVVVGGDVHFSFAHRIFNTPGKKNPNLLEFVTSAISAATIHKPEQSILKAGMGGKDFKLVDPYRAGWIQGAITFDFNYGEVLIDPAARSIELAVITESGQRLSFHTETY